MYRQRRMTPEELAKDLQQTIVVRHAKMYEQFLKDSSLSLSQEERFSRWPTVSRIYQTLTEDERHALRSVLSQVMVDTIASLLSILDGTTQLAGGNAGGFHLTHDDSPGELNDVLTDEFLVLFEDVGAR
jgi:hypothetical protein